MLGRKPSTVLLAIYLSVWRDYDDRSDNFDMKQCSVVQFRHKLTTTVKIKPTSLKIRGFLLQGFIVLGFGHNICIKV